MTLEPCNHHGRTPPCAPVVLASGVARVVIATADPNPRVAGGGADALRAAGVAVTVGCLAAEARALNRAFFTAMLRQRPHVTLKCAMSLDGKIADAARRARWLTGPEARREAHRMRADSDAVVVGIGTALADDPALDVRLDPPWPRHPLRVVVDSRARLSPAARVIGAGDPARAVVAVTEAAPSERVAALADRGATVLACKAREGRVDVADLLGHLFAMEAIAVLLEGGAGPERGISRGRRRRSSRLLPGADHPRRGGRPGGGGRSGSPAGRGHPADGGLRAAAGLGLASRGRRRARGGGGPMCRLGGLPPVPSPLRGEREGEGRPPDLPIRPCGARPSPPPSPYEERDLEPVVFTGLVEEVGRVLERAGSRLAVGASTVLDGSGLGASVAVNGVCLTVVARGPDRLEFDLGPETLAVTALGSLRAGDGINLERPLRLGGFVGGHLVQGHVDGVGRVAGRRPDGDAAWLRVEWRSPALAALLIPKGSVAVDGVSLTVAALGPDAFEIMLIPHTLAHTTLGGVAVGVLVNLEMDMIGKYVQRALELRGRGEPG